MMITHPGPSGSLAVATTSDDLARLEVRELIGLLARLEDATRGWPAAAWVGDWTVQDVDAEGVLSWQYQVIAELHRRRDL